MANRTKVIDEMSTLKSQSAQQSNANGKRRRSQLEKAKLEGLNEEVPIDVDSEGVDLRGMGMNFSFLRRATRSLALGLRNPIRAPKLWLLILLNVVCQVVGAYIIQALLYIVSTGVDTTYPGISGCLNKGCGGFPSPGSKSLVQKYMNQWGGYFAGSMICVILMSFTGDMINAIMRKNFTDTILAKLLTNGKLLYKLTVDGTMDNVDQRITSDVQHVFDAFSCVLFGNSADYLAYPIAFTVSRFSFALHAAYSLPEIHSMVKRGNVIGVVLAAVGVAIIVYILPVNVVARIFYRGQKFEGDFRTTHTKAVLSAEQISTLQGESAEKVLADTQHKLVDANNKQYYAWQGSLCILRLFITLAIPACSYICLSLMGTSDSTKANFFQKQIGDVFEYTLYLPVFVERLAYACGATHRVGQLLEHADRFDTNIEDPTVHSEKVQGSDNDWIELRNVQANPPLPLPRAVSGCCSGISFTEPAAVRKSGFLFQNVNLKINKGGSVCIVGPSGCGKSSLLRVIGGLWSVDSGDVITPRKVGKGGMFFLPQRPYVFPGSLRDQVCYPASSEDDSDRVEQILKVVHLQHLVSQYGVDSVMRWDTVLSISEMQRLNFARLFYHQPNFCLADECTSALDLSLESLLYQECNNRDITMVSVAHRPTVIPHHEFVYRYVKDSHGWEMVSAAEVKTCEKFPVDGLKDPVATESSADNDTIEETEGVNMKFFRRFFRAMSLGISKCLSQGSSFLLIMFCCMCIYGAMQVIIFRDYGTSKIIAQVTGTAAKAAVMRNGTIVTPAVPAIPPNLNLAMRGAGVILGLNMVSAVCQALSMFLGALLGVKIHRAVIKKFHAGYFTPGVVYHTNRVMKFKGVDQRVVQDLVGMREALAWLFGNPFAYFNYRVGAFPLLIVWLILFIYALTQTWQLTIFFLFFIIIAFAAQILASNVTSKKVGSRQRCEGDLRLHLGRVLQNIESITFFGGQQQEYEVATQLGNAMILARIKYSLYSNLTTVPTITMYYWLQTGVYVMAAILKLWWAPSAIQTSQLFTTINFNIIWAKVTQLIVQCLGGMGMVIGFTHRVMEVMEKVDEAANEVNGNTKLIKIVDDHVSLSDVNIVVPGSSSAALLKDLSLKVPKSLCIAGQGKSSVLRTLLGLWRPTKGTVSRPAIGRDGIFFVPQAAYATQGTLAQQIVYPALLADCNTSDEEFTTILDAVGLQEIYKRWGLHKVVNWDFVLSGGECQRLGFARVLFTRPRFAVLDETTSALDLATERKCMEAVLNQNITLLSFAARPSVFAYHEQKMDLADYDAQGHGGGGDGPAVMIITSPGSLHTQGSFLNGNASINGNGSVNPVTSSMRGNNPQEQDNLLPGQDYQEGDV